MRNLRSQTSQSAKYLQNKRKETIRKVFLLFIIGIIFIISFIFLIRLKFLQISHININGIQTLDNNAIQAIALGSIKGHYLYVIPRTSIFFYPDAIVEQNLKDNFKKIDKVEVNSSGLTGLEINIEEKKPIAIVCEGFKEDEGNEDQMCYFIDKHGVAFDKAPKFGDNVFTKYYVDSLDFFKKEIFIALQNFIKNINIALIDTTGILVGEDGSYELYIKNIDGSSAVVYFDEREPLEKTSSNFVAFWQDAKQKKLIFESINLRFGNNIVYTIKQDEN